MQQIALRVRPKLTELENDIALDSGLFARVKAVYEHRDASIRRTACCSSRPIKSFARNGAALSAADKELYRKYTSELSNLTLKFGQNSLAATNAFAVEHHRPEGRCRAPRAS